MTRLVDRVAVVTGAGSGIGAATARRLAAEGATVVAVDLDEEAAQQVAKGIDAEGGRARAARADVRRHQEVEAAIRAALDSYGRLDIVVNNAGIDVILPLAVVDEEVIGRLIDVNIRGVIYGMAAAAPIMVEAGGGAIVNVASVAAMYGVPLQAVYSGTKGAVVSLTRSAAMEYAPTVRVNCVCPGGIRTPIVESVFGGTPSPEMMEKMGRMHPLGRMGRPEEIASVIAFLASDDASFMTGAAVVADGGMTAGAQLDLSDLG